MTTQEKFQRLVDLTRHYDRFTCYIENYKQEQEAEKRNERMEAEFLGILLSLGLSDEGAASEFRRVIGSTGTVSSQYTAEQAIEMLFEKYNIIKEDDSMKKTNETNVTTNNATTKEDTTMKNANVHAENYVTKDAIRKELEGLGIILTKNQFKSTKRDELLAMLDKAKADAQSVPVGDLEITRDNADIRTPFVASDAVVRSIVATCCNVQWNNKHQVAKNYVSDYMLVSCINRALHGKWSKDSNTHVENKFTEEQNLATQDVKKQVLAGPFFIPYKEKGYIINAEYMAWFYETMLHKHVIYRFTYKDTSKGFVDYKIDKAKQVLINLKTNAVTQFDGDTWNKVNTTLNYNRAE